MMADASAPLDRVGFLIYRSGLAVSRGFERALKPIDATPIEAGLLSELAYGGSSHVRALARLLGISRQTIVNITKRLEEQKLVERSADALDARITVFSITSHGREKLKQIETIAAAFDEQMRQLLGATSESVLIPILKTIVDAPFLAYED